MAKKKNQLPSGNYRVQIYDYTDENEKKHYRSFTGSTKKDAQAKAAKWKANKDEERKNADDITVLEAVTRYIDIKKNVLSPSTLRGYDSLKRIHFSKDFGRNKLSSLTPTIVQIWVSNLSTKLSPKTVRNIVAQLSRHKFNLFIMN